MKDKTKEVLKETVKYLKMKTTILMDINLLPAEYKNDKEGIKKYEDDFDVKLIPYDSSRSNVGGSNIIGRPDIIKIAE